MKWNLYFHDTDMGKNVEEEMVANMMTSKYQYEIVLWRQV